CRRLAHAALLVGDRVHASHRSVGSYRDPRRAATRDVPVRCFALAPGIARATVLASRGAVPQAPPPPPGARAGPAAARGRRPPPPGARAGPAAAPRTGGGPLAAPPKDPRRGPESSAPPSGGAGAGPPGAM